MSSLDIKNIDGMNYLSSVDNNSVDLILTDPPYITSRKTGMDIHYNIVKENQENDIEYVKTEEEWNEYKSKNKIIETDEKSKFVPR